MIQHLYVENFVLIDKLDIDFSRGFSVFTGETGAGKSILIDAISLLCADRANGSLIAKGSSRAIIEGTFDLSDDSHAKKVLTEAGFDADELTVFTREVMSSQKSVARINHRIVTLALMKDCLLRQIDIHSQRDSQYLLDASSHIHLLDEFAEDSIRLTEVQNLYTEYRKLCLQKDQMLNEKFDLGDLEFFKYQIDEIEQSHLKPGEDEELESKEKNFHAVQESYEKLHHLTELYDDSISDTLYEFNHTLQNISGSDDLKQIQNTVNDSYYAFSDAAEQLKAKLDEFQMSEDDINAMEERLFLLQKLKRKYGGSIESVLQKKDELLQRTQQYEHRQQFLDEIDLKINEAKQKYDASAAILHKDRRKAGEALDKKICSNLKDLALPHARFKTDITANEASLYGSDRVEFLIAMNPGEDLKPLNKTASGGELSRLMLGLKEIFTKLQGIKTVIFDEIDTGVSGQVASAIGKKMRSLSKNTQVFAVTHLAPVAAYAEHHYLVKKNIHEGRTTTEIKLLNENETVNELALISSGNTSKTSCDAAAELYRNAQGK